MGYLIVFLVSLAVGGAVFGMSLRGVPGAGWSDPDADGGFGDHAELSSLAGSSGAGGSGTAYVPVATTAQDWQSRLTGVLGLVVSVAVAGIALAVGIYALGAVIGKLIGGLTGGGDPTAAP